MCACNGVLLCHTCHVYVTQNPTRARGEGLVVSAYEPLPGSVACRTFGGWQLNHCDGSITHLNTPREETHHDEVPDDS